MSDTENMLVAFDRWVRGRHGAVMDERRKAWITLFAAGWRAGIAENEAHHVRQDELFTRAIAMLTAEKDILRAERDALLRGVKEIEAALARNFGPQEK